MVNLAHNAALARLCHLDYDFWFEFAISTFMRSVAEKRIITLGGEILTF